MAVNDNFWVSETVKTPKLGSSSRGPKHKHVCLLLREGNWIQNDSFVFYSASTGQGNAWLQAEERLTCLTSEKIRVEWFTEWQSLN